MKIIAFLFTALQNLFYLATFTNCVYCEHKHVRALLRSRYYFLRQLPHFLIHFVSRGLYKHK